MKLTVIGGGGVHSVFLAKSIGMHADRLGIDKVCFTDTDEARLRVFGAMAAKVCRLLTPRLLFTCTGDIKEALSGADYIISAVRVGGDAARARDEHIALENGVLGSEDHGAAGFAAAARAVPVLAEYCALAKKYSSPAAVFLNGTAPVGLTTQALRDLGYSFVYGVCEAEARMLRDFARLLRVEPARVQGKAWGCGGVSFFCSVTMDGKEVLPALIENEKTYSETGARLFSKALLRRRQLIPGESLFCYYSSQKALADFLAAEECPGDRLLRVNRHLLDALSDRDIENDFSAALNIYTHYDALRSDAPQAADEAFRPFTNTPGGYAGVALGWPALLSGEPGSMPLYLPNNGTIPGLTDDDVILATCRLSPSGPAPLPFGSFEENALELVRRLKVYERKASAAIRANDAALAADALALHPLVNDADAAAALAQAYIETDRSAAAHSRPGAGSAPHYPR